MSKLDHQETHMRTIAANVNVASHTHPMEPRNAEKLPFTDPENHHHMSHDKHNYEDIGGMLQKHQGDPALKVCSRMLLSIGHP